MRGNFRASAICPLDSPRQRALPNGLWAWPRWTSGVGSVGAGAERMGDRAIHLRMRRLTRYTTYSLRLHPPSRASNTRSLKQCITCRRQRRMRCAAPSRHSPTLRTWRRGSLPQRSARDVSGRPPGPVHGQPRGAPGAARGLAACPQRPIHLPVGGEGCRAQPPWGRGGAGTPQSSPNVRTNLSKLFERLRTRSRFNAFTSLA